MRIAVQHPLGLVARTATLFAAISLGSAGFAAAQSVTPDGGSASAPAGSSGSVTFTVTNPTGSYQGYTLSCSRSGLVSSCTPSQTWVQVAPSGSAQVAVAYTTGNGAGNGSVVLTAEGEEQLCDPSPKGWCPPPEQDTGYYTVTVWMESPPVVTIMTGTSVVTRTPLLAVWYSDPNDNIDTAAITVTWGGANVTALGRFNAGLWEWEVEGSSHQLAPGGSKTLYVQVCDVTSACSSASRSVGLLSSPRPLISTVSTMPLEALGRQHSQAFGPWSVSGPDVSTSISTPAYYTFNSAHTAGLTYSSRQSYPSAVVAVDLEFPGGQASSLTMRLKDNGVTVSTFTIASPSCASGSGPVCRTAFDVPYLSLSGAQAVRKWLTVEAEATFGSGTYSSVDSVEVVLVDRRTTPYGSGWWPSGVMRLVVAGEDRLIVASDGSATVYRGHDGQFISPPASTVTLVAVGAGHELRFRGGGKIVFDSQGRQTSMVDVSGNTTTISYLSTDQVYRITDPVGKYFEYVYDGSGKILRIQDFNGRQTQVTLSGARLHQVTSPSPAGLTYSTRFVWSDYAGSATLPIHAISATDDTTTLSWSGHWAWQAILPQIKTEAGNDTLPDFEYHVGTRWAVGTLQAHGAWDFHLRTYDAKDQWTALDLNRWGQPTQVTDVIGTLSRVTYDAAGRMLTAEGKVGDSTRVYYTYDSRGRHVRTHRFAGATMLRLDSLVYDASDRVVERVTMLGSRTTFAYDGLGRLIRAVGPDADTTLTWYRANGQVDSTRSPHTIGATRFTYNSLNNTSAIWGPGQWEPQQSNLYDGLGRLVETRSAIPVEMMPSEEHEIYRWRRRVTFLNVANQVDSTRSEQTDPCSNPAGCQPTWPSPTDLTRTYTVRRTFNTRGMDSTRAYQNGLAELFSYDRLGRLSRHWPQGTGYESLVYNYDVLGNLRFLDTRRGHTLEARYDSRNRVIKRIQGTTVGTFNYTYGGPNDELTAITAESGYADGVGGTNVNATWSYNQSGELLSETSQGNRTTTYARDGLRQVTQVTDAVGTRNLSYWPGRNVVTQVTDPTTGDRIEYEFDKRMRLNGPTITSGAELFRRDQVWADTTGGVAGITNWHWWGLGYDPGGLTETQLENLTTLEWDWVEEQGNGGTVVNQTETIETDGWGRVTEMAHATSGASSVTETFGFDARGNLTLNGNGPTYDSRDRLTAVNGCTALGYDQAGNLTGRTCGGVSWIYNYDALDRLTSVTNSSGLTAFYTYDVLGNRVAKRVGSTTTRFVWRGGQISYETGSNIATVTRSYVWGVGADDLIAIHDHSNGNHYYVVQDRLRSVRGLVPRNGNWQAAWRYRAYGTELSSAGSAASTLRRFRWAGAQYDAETGFYFLRSRYYDPTVGRFVQEDKIGRSGGNNMYAYGANPVLGRDPTGMTMDYDAQYFFFHREDFRPRYDGYAGWHGTFDNWDVLTLVEKWDGFGNVTFESELARDTFYDLYRRAVNDSWNGTSLLFIQLKASAQNFKINIGPGDTWGFGRAVCEEIASPYACSWDAGGVTQINIDPALTETTSVRNGIGLGVLLAHELGHYFQPWIGPLSAAGDTGAWALYWENQARLLYGCTEPRVNHYGGYPGCGGI